MRAAPSLRREHAADTVSHLAGPRCLIESKHEMKHTRHVSKQFLFYWKILLHSEARNRIRIRNGIVSTVVSIYCP